MESFKLVLNLGQLTKNSTSGRQNRVAYQRNGIIDIDKDGSILRKEMISKGVRKRGKAKYRVDCFELNPVKHYFWRRNPESLTESYLRELGLEIRIFGYRIEFICERC